MARPRIFVSSTYYDLKHVRSSLDVFIKTLGYDSVLSEKGDIAYTHDRPLDESCYREAEGADIFVLIIGGRYGSESSDSSKALSRSFFDRYESITKKEYESAVIRDIPIYVLIENGVHSEYQTFLRNKENDSINYAHVDTVNIFYFIEDILARPRNNPVHTFERFADIEFWLREQWAGLFRELLHRQSQQQQLIALAAQVSGLKEINETLKKYLEALMTGVTPDVSTKLIASEEKRLEELRQGELLRSNGVFRYFNGLHNIPFETCLSALRKSKSVQEFVGLVSAGTERPEEVIEDFRHLLKNVKPAREDLNAARHILGLEPYDEADLIGSEEMRADQMGGRRSRRSRETRADGSGSIGGTG